MSSKPHNNKPRALSSQEKQYALRQLRGVGIGVKAVSLVFWVMAVAGFVMIFWFVEDEALAVPGLLLVAVGLGGFIGLSLYASGVRYQVEPDSQWRRGRLAVQLVGHGRYGPFAPFVDELRLYSGINGYVMVLCERYSEQKVAVEMAVIRYTRKQKTGLYHVPLRIGDDLCVSRALRTHGPRFALLPSLLAYAYVLLGFVLIGILWVVGGYALISTLIPLLGHGSGELMVGILVAVWCVATMEPGIRLASRLTPDGGRILERRVRCESAGEVR